MRRKPISIILISFICVLMTPFYLGFQFYVNSLDPLAALHALNPIHFAISLIALPVGFGVFRVRQWGYIGFLVLSTCLVGYFLYSYFASPVLNNYLLLIATTLLVGGVSLILQKHVSAPYFNPQLRWWERFARYQVNIEASFQIDGDQRIGNLLDLSLSGCYATVDTKLAVGDTVKVGIRLLDFDIKTSAKVVWINNDTGGYGIMFTSLDRNEKKKLNSIINYLVVASHSSHEEIIDRGVPKHDSVVGNNVEAHAS